MPLDVTNGGMARATSSGLECEDWLLLQKSVGGGCGGPWCMSPLAMVGGCALELQRRLPFECGYGRLEEHEHLGRPSRGSASARAAMVGRGATKTVRPAATVASVSEKGLGHARV